MKHGGKPKCIADYIDAIGFLPEMYRRLYFSLWYNHTPVVFLLGNRVFWTMA